MDTEPVSWRIYRDEWITMYVAFEHADQTPIERATAHFDQYYQGRVLARDVEYEIDNTTYGQPAAILRLRLPNLRGEWKPRELAQEFADRSFAGEENVMVVATDSREEQDLKGYGVKMLPEHEHQLVELYDRIAVEPDAADSV